MDNTVRSRNCCQYFFQSCKRWQSLLDHFKFLVVVLLLQDFGKVELGPVVVVDGFELLDLSIWHSFCMRSQSCFDHGIFDGTLVVVLSSGWWCNDEGGSAIGAQLLLLVELGQRP